MALAKVWNDNVYPHVEEFKSQKLEIPAGGFIEMDYDEAVMFKGQFKAPIIDGGGNHDPRGFKKLRIEAAPKVATYNPLMNPLTGKVCATKAELDAELKMAKDLLITKNPAEDASELATLKAQVAASDDKVTKLTALLDELLAEREAKKGKPIEKPVTKT